MVAAMSASPATDPSDFARFLHWRRALAQPAMTLDFGRAGLRDEDLDAHGDALGRALEAMHALEGGAIANPDEQRQVGHYWLRAPELAPEPAIADSIRGGVDAVCAFAASVAAGDVAPPEGGRFRALLVVGIGGSALGPMLIADAFGGGGAGMPVTVLDNTDPDGIDRTLASLAPLQDVLVCVISKSGGTPETRNGMLEVEHALRTDGLALAPRAVAITQVGSALHQRAVDGGWLATFEMWDWVGGRTSQLSAVGLLPAALGGVDVRALLRGAAAVDRWTRAPAADNPAALMALWWWLEGCGRGERAMVVLPYKDRLQLFGRYLQQLVMESLGKRLDRAGAEVHQGLTVYGNKGSTDQHAYVQQLRDGRHDFFAVFVRVLEDRAGESIEVEPGVTAGDYLDGFLLGTRSALDEAGRRSLTITLRRVDAESIGGLIALFERAVGLYAELIDINAYHQPGVEAGKRAAAQVLDLQRRALAAIDATPRTCVELAAALDVDPADLWPVLEHLAHNRSSVAVDDDGAPEAARFHGPKIR